MILGELVTVADEATAIATAGTDRNGVSVTIQVPSGGQTVFLGGSDVTSAAYGHALAAGGLFSMELARGETLYGVVASSTQQVAVLTSDAIG